MRKPLLKILQCPYCKSELDLTTKKTKKIKYYKCPAKNICNKNCNTCKDIRIDILEGNLSCKHCKKSFKIKQAIPCFEAVSEYSLRSETTKVDKKTENIISSLIPKKCNYSPEFIKEIAFYIYDTFVLNNEIYHYLKQDSSINKTWLDGNIKALIDIENYEKRYSKLFPNIKKSNVAFDIACGTGAVAASIAKLGPAVIGVDADFRALTLAKERERYDNIYLDLIKADINFLPLRDNIADTGLTIETIEHVSDPKKVLLEMWRLVASQGVFYIHTPNKYFPIDCHDSNLPFIHWLPYPLANRIAIKLKRANIIYNPKTKQLEWGLNHYLTYRRVLKILNKPKIVNEFFPVYNPNPIKNFLIKTINTLSFITRTPKTAFTGCFDIVVQKP